MSQITRGLSKIEVGAIAADGGMGLVLAALGFTDRDSTASLVEEDPTRDEIFGLEVDTALDVDITAGALVGTFSVVNADLDTLVKLWGGVITGAGDARTWSKSGSSQSIERSVKITPRKGYVLSFPRVSLVPKLNFDMTKSGKMLIDIVFTVLQPTKEGVDPVLFGPKVAVG